MRFTALTCSLAAALVLGLCFGSPVWASTATTTKARQAQLQALFAEFSKAEKAEDPVRAYLYLREAIRLEQVWSNNTVTDESLAHAYLRRFTSDLLHKEDGRLLKLLHAKQVPTNDKLNLLRLLDDDIILNYPGKHGDELIGDLAE